mgnify:CR=1 FL=1
MHHITHRQLDHLPADGARNVGDGNDLRRHMAGRGPPAYAGSHGYPTPVRLARPGIARLAIEDGKAVLYHCVDNARIYHGNPLSPLEFELDDAPALELLLTTVEPRWIQVQDLIHIPHWTYALAQDLDDNVKVQFSIYNKVV